MLYVIHNSHKYKFHQVARCIHCTFCYLSPSKSGNSGVWICSLTRKFISPQFLHCPSFVCNSKYELYKSSVQLNLFDNEKSVSELSAVRQ